MKILFGLCAAMLLACALGTTGCKGAGMANVSKDGTAWVVTGNGFRTQMNRCTAANPQKPVCVEVVEQ